MLQPSDGLSRFENLPDDVLTFICEHLESVLAFRLTSKRCFVAANAAFYSSINIRFSTPEVLLEDVQWWKLRLETEQSFQYTRCLKLTPATLEPFQRGASPDLLDEQLYQRWQYLRDFRQVVPGDKQDQEWQVVADLIGLLPGLAEVRYSCWPQLAPCVLSAIEAKPGCKLFHHTFALRSLLQPPKQPVGFDPYELKLATSPSLYSIITTKFETYNQAGYRNLLEHASLTLASGLATNLESMSLCYWFGSTSHESFVAHDMTNPSWPRHIKDPVWEGTEFQSMPVCGSKSSVRSLELKHRGICELAKLKHFASAIDFSKLTTLKIRDNVGTKIMKWLSSEVYLNSLHTLVLNLQASQEEWYPSGINLVEEEAELMRLFVDLSNRLPSLRSTRINGSCTYEGFGRFLKPHAATLQKLALFIGSVRRWSHVDNVTNEQWDCTALKELSIAMRRTDGDKEEVRFYKWVGANFPNLRRLFLYVDCSYAGPRLNKWSPDFGKPNVYRKFDSQLYDLKHVLRNYAIDKTLSESIFRTISAAKPAGSPSLERLELKIMPERPDEYPDDFLKMCVTVLGRNWVCSQQHWNSQTRRLVFEDSMIFNEDDFTTDPGIGDKAIEIFHTLWPEQTGKPWRESWCSFPLAT